MTINLSMPKSQADLRPSILVVGVGGAGGNAVNNMIRSNLEGVDFVVCNTDAQALNQSLSERQIQMGLGTTEGLGAGSRPEIGAAAAEEALWRGQLAEILWHEAEDSWSGGSSEFLCDTCRYNDVRDCHRTERPNATSCDDYRRR